LNDITRHRAYLYVDHSDDPYSDGDAITRWAKKWGSSVVNVDAREYGYYIEAPIVALQELPKRLFSQGTGTTYPIRPDGVEHLAWSNHFDDGKPASWARRGDA
jgi:hypothetical protein